MKNNYQLDFLKPVIKPKLANLRNDILDNPQKLQIPRDLLVIKQ